jgi:hypothetical protein
MNADRTPHHEPSRAAAAQPAKTRATGGSARASRPCGKHADQSEAFVDNLGPEEVQALNVRLRSMWSDIQAKYVLMQSA